MPEKIENRFPGPDQDLEKFELIQLLTDAQTIADALSLHLCAALVDQALEQARKN